MTADTSPTWTTPAGRIRGWVDGEVVRATGIRYARAKRYAAPVPEAASEALIDATHWGPACPQAPAPRLDALLGKPLGDLVFDEDCLRLSVTLPRGTTPDAGLPVVVFIHGGSYTWGAGDAPIFDPAYFVAEQHVIVVSVSYRLGILGYLGFGDRPANLGLLDQIEALRWVQANIASFGGDPGNVTAFGQSAGADAVAHLMISDGVEGLFQRVIVASAPMGAMGGRDALVARMAEVAGPVAVDAPVADILAVHDPTFLSAQGHGLRSGIPFGVAYGQAPLPPEDEARAAWRAAARRYRLLIGWTSRDGAMFVIPAPKITRLLRLPLIGRSLAEVAVRIVTRLVFSARARAFARAHRRAGGRGYRYVISWGPRGNPYRATHTYDTAFAFPNDAWRGAKLIEGATHAEVVAAGAAMRRMLGDFARNGTVEVGRVPGNLEVRALR